ncbi:nitroreductase family deazaflavin-dependent oxidoreductase [Rhodococcus rhodochrous]|uniref:nitroreductase/quinone reductase family protein n=1 Tax=Rhodococcus rhodochrous TaxID=1829 RepID=UPI001E53483B|nr:nitroreductase/quinone reductase family protein [Rhodococcus rhodochrous]MCB8914004.1 nitroreductase family deazaflavin-dependent oxidoreductase [Rhodococcus rhodochrous]
MTGDTPDRGHSITAAAQAALYESSEGQQGWTRKVDGRDVPCVLLSYRGRRTGAVRSAPVIRVADEGRYILVGSLGGADVDPWWVINLRHDPRLRLRDRGRVFETVAEELSGSAREQAWSVATHTFPRYEDYQSRTGRLIPVFAAPIVL